MPSNPTPKATNSVPALCLKEDGASRKFFTAKDGTNLSFLEAGTQGKPCLILVHGFGAQARFFLPQLRSLGNDYHLLVPDLRGHGASEKGSSAPSLDLLADDLAELMTSQGISQAAALGWSLGAQVWLAYLQSQGSDKLTGLIVEDMTPKVLLEEDWTLGARGLDRQVNAKVLDLMENAWEDYCAFFEPALFARPTEQSAEVLSWIAQIKEQGDPRFLAALWRSLLAQDFRALLPQLTLPILVVHGGKSHFYNQAVADYWLDHCPQASEHCFPQSGHTPHLEEASRFTALLRETFEKW